MAAQPTSTFRSPARKATLACTRPRRARPTPGTIRHWSYGPRPEARSTSCTPDGLLSRRLDQNYIRDVAVLPGEVMAAGLGDDFERAAVEEVAEGVFLFRAEDAQHVLAAQFFDLGLDRVLRLFVRVRGEAPSGRVFEVDQWLEPEERDELRRFAQVARQPAGHEGQHVRPARVADQQHFI